MQTELLDAPQHRGRTRELTARAASGFDTAVLIRVTGHCSRWLAELDLKPFAVRWPGVLEPERLPEPACQASRAEVSVANGPRLRTDRPQRVHLSCVTIALTAVCGG